jgi:hypothetical protein
MKDLEQIVEGYITPAPQKKGLLFEDLAILIEEALSEQQLVQKGEVPENLENIDIEDILGTLQIDIAKWGKRSSNPASEDQERKIIQNYIKSIGGNEPDAILKNLEFAFEKEGSSEDLPSDSSSGGNCDLARVVSKIQLLNTLSIIVNHFDPSAAGFIMEGFLSAVFPGGKVVKVTDSLGVEDFVVAGSDGDIHYSLKTIVAESDFGGSIVDLMRSIDSKGEIIYYIFGKVRDEKKVATSITVHKVIINADNLFVITNVTEENVIDARKIIARKEEKDAAEQAQEAPDQESPDQESPDELRHNPLSPETPTQRASRFALAQANHKEKYPDRYEETPPEDLNEEKLKRGAGKFKVRGADYYSTEPIATLTIDAGNLLVVAQRELKGVLGQLIEVQKKFKQLVYEMNHYFSSMDATSAGQLKTEALSFSTAVEQNIKGDETCESV